MTIITNFPKMINSNSCRYYVCFANLGKQLQCLQFSSEKKYRHWKEQNNKRNYVSYRKYCSKSKYLDKFFLFAESINYRLPIITTET